jgi:hypothetical protein
MKMKRAPDRMDRVIADQSRRLLWEHDAQLFLDGIDHRWFHEDDIGRPYIARRRRARLQNE